MKGSRGFTLTEVLVAAVVLGMAASALFGLLSKSMLNLRKVEELNRYQLVAQDLMNRVLFLPSLAPGTVEGAVGDSGGRWTVTVTPWGPSTLEKKPDLAVLKIDVIVSWPGRSSQRSIDVESLKVVKVDYTNFDLHRAIDSAYPQ